MNRTLRVLIAILFVVIIIFSAISICQNFKRPLRADITEENLYTLSEGTVAILEKLNQPITIKLYYSRKAALNAPDWIKAFNNHYLFIQALLQEYVNKSRGKIEFQEIDPRQFSQEEVDAKEYGLAIIPLPGPEEEERENFIFGLVVQTQLGAAQNIPFFPPERKHLVEYKISRAIDTAIMQAKKKIGILSSLPVMGDIRYQQTPFGPQPQRIPEWEFVRQLSEKYEVKKIEAEVEKIDANDLDILLVVHPKKLPQKTLFAIDQFVLTPNKRAIVFLDPYAEIDFLTQPPPNPQQYPPQQQDRSVSSQLTVLLWSWGLEMPAYTYAADSMLTGPRAWWRHGRNPQVMQYKPIGFLHLKGECFSTKNAISAGLDDFRMFFAGALRERKSHNPDLILTPLLMTTPSGNVLKTHLEEYTVPKDLTEELRCTQCFNTLQKGEKAYRDIFDEGNLYCSHNCANESLAGQIRSEISWPELQRRFQKGEKAVPLAYLITGKFKTAFPKGIELESDTEETSADPNSESDEKPKSKTRKMPGLLNCTNGAAMVVADVDCLHEICLYKLDYIGRPVPGENMVLLENAIDFLSGSDELIKVRTRGRPRRFVLVDKIEQEAKEKTEQQEAEIEERAAREEAEIEKKIEALEQQKQESLRWDPEKKAVVLNLEQLYQAQYKIVQQINELKRRKDEIRLESERQKREIKNSRRETIEAYGAKIKTINLLTAPSIILLIAIVLGIYRNVKRRHYISHASDA